MMTGTPRNGLHDLFTVSSRYYGVENKIWKIFSASPLCPLLSPFPIPHNVTMKCSPSFSLVNLLPSGNVTYST